VFSDYIYLDLSNTEANNRSLYFGNLGIPAEVGIKTTLGITGWVWNTAGTYTVVDNSWYSMSVLAGVRFLDLEEELEWERSSQIGDDPVNARSGNVKVKDNVLDAIVGVRGEVKFGQSNWSAPYYLDVGTGDTKYSVQGAVGINYAFKSFDLGLSYRYLEWDLDSNAALDSLSFSGVQFGVGYRW
jgi:opacity protein-like surface antigen